MKRENFLFLGPFRPERGQGGELPIKKVAFALFGRGRYHEGLDVFRFIFSPNKPGDICLAYQKALGDGVSLSTLPQEEQGYPLMGRRDWVRTHIFVLSGRERKPLFLKMALALKAEKGEEEAIRLISEETKRRGWVVGSKTGKDRLVDRRNGHPGFFFLVEEPAQVRPRPILPRIDPNPILPSPPPPPPSTTQPELLGTLRAKLALKEKGFRAPWLDWLAQAIPKKFRGKTQEEKFSILQIFCEEGLVTKIEVTKPRRGIHFVVN